MATHAATASDSQRLEPLTKRRSWQALQAHYRKVNALDIIANKNWVFLSADTRL